ncbi:MAG: DNA (cytosine-5-)-methyltransferase, partial [Peptoniphilus harei]|nr:DNA (cytosine-5-)-methyltransferase [Peptoniphilus harei]
MKLTVAELFAGVGGFRVGLNHIDSIDENGLAIENGDWKFVWANQFEPSTKIQPAFECYVKRFGEEKNSNVDINKVNKKEIPDHSLLVGGFPCQDYSVARSLSKEMGIEGKKGVLFWDIKDVIVEKKSPFILLENVDRLLKSPASQRGRDFAIMLKTFNELGYDVQWRVINAGDYSMPQKRRRVFIFAYKNNSRFSQWVKNESLNLNKKNIFNDLFPVEEIKECEKIDLDNYEDILDVSNNFNNGKFLESGIMIDGEISHSKIIPISERKHTLSKVLDVSKEYNTSLDEFVVEDEKLEKWKYLKGSKRIERTSA